MKYAQALEIIKAHKAAATDDVKALFNPTSKHHYSESVHAYALQCGIDLDQALRMPQKQLKRFTQFLNAMHSGQYGLIDYTHARILVAMHLAGSYKLTTDAVTIIAANARSGDVNTRGVTLSAVNRIFKQAHALGTVKTKVSNSTGKNGFYQVLGMTYAEPGKQNHEISLCEKHPLIVRFFALINGASAGQLDEMMGDK